MNIRVPRNRPETQSCGDDALTQVCLVWTGGESLAQQQNCEKITACSRVHSALEKHLVWRQSGIDDLYPAMDTAKNSVVCAQLSAAFIEA